MIIIGCDYHTAFQQIAFVDTLWRAHAQSSFHDSIRRTQCDQQPMVRRNRLDFVSTALLARAKRACPGRYGVSACSYSSAIRAAATAV